MKPYSNDLRTRVIQAYQDGEGSQRQIARRFCVCLATVQNWLKRHRDTGCLEPKSYQRGPRPRIDDHGLQSLHHLLQTSPDATLDQMCEHYYACLHVRVSKPTMCRALQKLRECSRPKPRKPLSTAGRRLSAPSAPSASLAP